MDMLLTWVGSRDPVWDNPRTGEPSLGPVLSLLEARRFDQVHLFFNAGRNDNEFGRRASAVRTFCSQHLPDLEVIFRAVELISVTDYREIYRVVTRECQEILQLYSPQTDNLYVYLSPGTPQMQTVWVLLVQSGLLPATMLEGIPRDLVKPGEPWWRQLDLTFADFPKVVAPSELESTLGVLQVQNAALLAENERLQLALELRQAADSESPEASIANGFNLADYLANVERSFYLRAMQQACGNASAAARLLAVQPHTFRKRAARLGIRNRQLHRT